uniref:Uncharacterized protein n=1 Tax=Setaria viridis TaxID=4556 RepID=A0A4U6VS08_SETVI|nr:hypothetical protein SEVIR_5G328401v2 [Setaria viridis]TKW27659.1 hypothetical protein SEVIR_3G272113v2 [Setaria viridis]TKW31624.1 hypothetical protein SEVIR_2G117833v2 [Setaria viridis]
MVVGLLMMWRTLLMSSFSLRMIREIFQKMWMCL